VNVPFRLHSFTKTGDGDGEMDLELERDRDADTDDEREADGLDMSHRGTNLIASTVTNLLEDEDKEDIVTDPDPENVRLARGRNDETGIVSSTKTNLLPLM
jgi:hypothetical protein